MSRHYLIFGLFFLVACTIGDPNPMGGYNPLNTMNVMGVQGSDTGGVGVNTPMTIGSTGQVAGPQYKVKTGARPVTLRFSITGGMGNPPIAAHALIIASVGGNQITRQVTVGQGTAITMAAEAVAVYFYDITQAANAGGSNFNGQSYSIFTQIVEGLRADFLTPPTLLNLPGGPGVTDPTAVPIYVLSPSATQTVKVPLNVGVNAVRVAVTSTAGTFVATNVIVTAFAASGLGLYSWYPNVDPGWISLPAGTTALVIQVNAGDLDPENVSVLWGIEG